MARRRNRVPATKFLVSLPGPLSIELEAFCRAHYNAPRMEVIRRALQDYLVAQLANNPALKRDYLTHKAELTEAPLRLVAEGDPKNR